MTSQSDTMGLYSGSLDLSDLLFHQILPLMCLSVCSIDGGWTKGTHIIQGSIVSHTKTMLKHFSQYSFWWNLKVNITTCPKLNLGRNLCLMPSRSSFPHISCHSLLGNHPLWVTAYNIWLSPWLCAVKGFEEQNSSAPCKESCKHMFLHRCQSGWLQIDK